MLNRYLFHQGGHEHGGGEHHHHNPDHKHADDHDHNHSVPELSEEQTLALMTYMLEHNRSHAKELHDIGHALEAQGKPEAAELVFESVHFFEHCNDKLESALIQTKGV